MQKDFHYYMTLALAVKSGIEFETAKQIAWSDQFTDDCRECELYGIRTQCGIIDQWYSREVQQFVLVPFHFLPGDDKENPWIVTPDSEISRKLCRKAIDNKDPISLGIALHSLQDTFSHQSFTGWQDKVNAKYLFNTLPYPTPDIGHADFGYDPDIISAEWTNQSGNIIRNWQCARLAAIETYEWLYQFGEDKPITDIEYFLNWFDKKFAAFWRINDYEARKTWLLNWSELPEDNRYKAYEPPTGCRDNFIKAARKQISIVMDYISNSVQRIA